jgi:hypothetical protein
MYSEQDLELIDEKLDNIIKVIDDKKKIVYGHKEEVDEIMRANKIVMDYIRDNKRKIYGGFAQNNAIVKKNPKDAFYTEDELPDIDFYSPEPLKDVVELSNILHAAGFKKVNGKQAIHAETYKVFANESNVADISYVPRNIYNKIPFIEIDGINYVHPSFMYIDLYRMLTDPHFSSFRWGKTPRRLYKLQKHYPFNKTSKPLNNAYDVPKDKQEKIKKINKLLIDYISNKENFIIVGQYAYNYYLEQSGISKENKMFKPISIPFMQLISTNYILDTIDLIKYLESKLDKITFREFYPLWQFTGYSTVVYYDKFPILHVTSHNKKCMPVHKVKIDSKNTIQVGSFDVTFLFNLISHLRVRTNEIEAKIHYHNIMTSHLVDMRNYYFKKNKKTLLDESPFQSLIAECVGDAVDPMKEAKEERDRKKEQGKMIIWQYNPTVPKDPPDYKFANTSGNEIMKNRNLKIGKYINNPDLLKKELEKN